MAITEAFANTATISTTEYSLPNNSTTLTPITDDGIYQVFIDMSALTATEAYKLLVKEKVTSGGGQQVVQGQTIVGNMTDDCVVLPSFVFLHGWDVTLQKLQGTDRSISWSIRKVA